MSSGRSTQFQKQTGHYDSKIISMKLFWLLWMVNALASIGVLYFFIDAGVDTLPLGYAAFFLLFAVFAALLCGSLYCFKKGQSKKAKILLGLNALLAVLMGFYAFHIVLSIFDWR
jgi:prepilin signal peptidase PulO-like enzyme (type II secretory pathway)